MKNKENIKVCLVGSSGGHLTHLYMLKPFWKNKDHFWVTFDKEDARSLLEGEKMYPCYYPTNRSLKALIKNTKIAWNVLHNASIILYYLLNIEKIKQFLFDRDFPRRILEIFPFFSAIATIVAQYFYIAHYNEPAFVAINAAFSNRPYFGKIALETYGVSLFGQPITWLTGTDGTKVSGMDYFYVDSSYLQVLVRYGVIMLVVLCLAMMAVQCYSVVTKNIYL